LEADAILDRSGEGAKVFDLLPSTFPPAYDKLADKPKITIIDYDEQHYHEAEFKEAAECFVFKEKPTVTWINIDGLHQVDILEKLGAGYGIHPLVLEDILSDQRPKIEDYD